MDCSWISFSFTVMILLQTKLNGGAGNWALSPGEHRHLHIVTNVGKQWSKDRRERKCKMGNGNTVPVAIVWSRVPAKAGDCSKWEFWAGAQRTAVLHKKKAHIQVTVFTVPRHEKYLLFRSSGHNVHAPLLPSEHFILHMRSWFFTLSLLSINKLLQN